MNLWPFNKLSTWLTNWLMKSQHDGQIPACDFERIKYELRPCDVILVEGENRVSEVIKLITRSNWSHAAIYIGRLQDIKEEDLRHKVLQHYKGDINEPLLIEGILGKGIIVSALSSYQNDHVRICRPSGITMSDANKVIAFCIKELGLPYNVRHIIDLLRLLFPITLLPRHLFSSLFRPRAIENRKQICSSLLAEAFGSVHYPIMPKIKKTPDGGVEFIQRNPNLFTPKDFDYSPYFEIIKYPLFGLESTATYRQLPWNQTGALYNDETNIYIPKE